MDGSFMAGFYGGRVPGAPGPPPTVGHPYPGVPPGPHRPSPWPTGIPGYPDYDANRALMGGGPGPHGFSPYYSHPLAQHHPYASAAHHSLFAAEAARMAEMQRAAVESQHRAAVESQHRAIASAAAASNASASAALQQKEDSAMRMALTSGLTMPQDPYSLSSLDRGLFPPRRDFLEPLHAGPASDRGYERTASLERGFEHRMASFHPPASHLSAATSQPSPTILASQTVTTTTTTSSSTSFGNSGLLPRCHETNVVVIEEEEEEELLLVDDFDGQCCRTYPFNHSKIIAWRKIKEERERKSVTVVTPSASASASATFKDSRASDKAASASTSHRQSLSPKRKTHHSSSANDSKPPTSAPAATTGSSIPVGIAIGRQRQQDGSSMASEKKRITNESSTELTPLSDQVYPSLPSGSATPWGLSVPPGPHSGPSVYPSGSPFTSGPPHWMPPHGMPHPMGPIPMGYQLAKDPLTGQMLLIPTDSGQPHHAGLWPPHPYDSLRMQPSSAAAAHYHHQMYLQQQQQQQQQQRHLHYMRAASAMRSSPSRTGLTPRLGLEPETITVSDDDDDHVAQKKQEMEAKDLSTKSEVPMDCSTKEQAATTSTFVPYRETFSNDTVVSAPTSSSPSFMPSFSPKVKIEPVASKCDTQSEQAAPQPEEQQQKLPIKEQQQSIKEEPKDESNLEVCDETETSLSAPKPADSLTCDVTNVKSEVPELVAPAQTAIEAAECADVLLSLADMFSTDLKAPIVKQEAVEQIEEILRPEFEGLDLLLEGIKLHLKDEFKTTTSWSPDSWYSFSGLEALYAATRQDACSLGIWDDLSVLCAVTEEDYFEYLNWVDPMIELKNRFNLHDYKCESSKNMSRRFINDKIKKFKKMNEAAAAAQNENDDSTKIAGFEALDEVIKRIKNTDFMSQLEVELRSQLAQLQELYKDRQKEVTRHKSSPKKVATGQQQQRNSKTRGPGRPKKRCLKSSAKTKMGRPRKRQLSDEEGEEEEDEDEQDEGDEANLSPPVLQPWSTSSRSPSPPSLFHSVEASKEGQSVQPSSSSTSSGLLKPPKLTASFSPQSTTGGVVRKFGSTSNSVTNLSMINARFMKGKANPFQNLMKLATVPSGPESCKNDDVDDAEEQDSSSSTEEEDRREKVSSGQSIAAKESAESGCDRKYSDPEDGSASKRRKSEKPRRHCGSTETIVSKQPKNLFMMNCMTLQRGFSGKNVKNTAATSSPVDEYDFNEEEEFDVGDEVEMDERWGLTSKSKMFSQYRESVQPSPPPPAPTSAPKSKPLWSPSSVLKSQPKTDTVTPPPKSSEPSSKCEGEKKKPFKVSTSPILTSTSSSSSSSSTSSTSCSIQKQKTLPPGTEMLRSAILTESDLTDGLRILILQEGRFWPARLNSTQLPDVYGVVVEKQRGNRPLHLPRDDILKEAVLDIKPKSKHQLPYGTRVCVFWSQVYNCLFPATVEQLDIPVKDNMVEVVLDDGDRRQVDIEKVRMLPHNYSRVVYDPDPISSLRKRRISADSVDSGSASGREMHPHTAHDLNRQAVTSSSHSMAPATPVKTNHVTSDAESSSPLKRKKSRLDKSQKKHKKKHKHHHCKHKHKKHKSSPDTEDEADVDVDVVVGEEEDLRIKLDGSFNNTTTYSIRSPIYHARSEESNHDEEGDDESSEDDDGFLDDEHVTTVKAVGEPKKPHIEGLNPVTGRPLWHWSDEGYRRPGSKGKAKKLFHRAIKRGPELISVGDCAVFLSTARVDRPYIGQVEMLWETWNGNMMVKVKWFYHPEEIETHGKGIDLKYTGGLFQSPHTDENDVQTISHKCQVLALKEYSRFVENKKGKKASGSTGEPYYLAGSYDPTAMLVNFQNGVLKHHHP